MTYISPDQLQHADHLPNDLATLTILAKTSRGFVNVTIGNGVFVTRDTGTGKMALHAAVWNSAPMVGVTCLRVPNFTHKWQVLGPDKRPQTIILYRNGLRMRNEADYRVEWPYIIATGKWSEDDTVIADLF